MVMRNDRLTLVVGAGAAGISAVAWLRELEMPFRWIACSSTETTLDRVGNRVATLPPVAPAAGAHLAEQLRLWCAHEQLEPELNVRAEAFETQEDHLRVTLHHLASGERTFVACAAVLLATGTRPRMLGLPEERDLLHQGVELSVTRRREAYKHRPCVVVGGGDAALEGALLLAEVTSDITLVHRRRSLRGQRRFVDAVTAHPSIRLRCPNRIAALELDANTLRAVVLDDGERLPAAGLFVRIGVEASVPASLPEEARDAAGYLIVDATGRSRVPRLYGAGDVCSPLHQSVAWSIGQAARTVATIRADLQF